MVCCMNTHYAHGCHEYAFESPSDLNPHSESREPRQSVQLRSTQACLELRPEAIGSTRMALTTRLQTGTVNFVIRRAGMIAGLLPDEEVGDRRCAVLQGVSVPAGDHQPLCLVVLPVPAELP
jgi:hypothetical protein